MISIRIARKRADYIELRQVGLVPVPHDREQEHYQDRGRRGRKRDLPENLKMSRPVDLCRLDQHFRYLAEKIVKDQDKDLRLQPLPQDRRHDKCLDRIDQPDIGIKHICRHHRRLRRQDKGEQQQSDAEFFPLEFIARKTISHNRTDHDVDQCRNARDHNRIAECLPVVHRLECLFVIIKIQLAWYPVDRSVEQVIEVHKALADHIEHRIEIDEPDTDQQQVHRRELAHALGILGAKDKFPDLISDLFTSLRTKHSF